MANPRLSRSLLPTPQRPSLSSAWAIVAVLAATGGMVGGGWFAIQLIVNPQSLLWINQFLPGWIPRPATGLRPPQTMEQIRKELNRAGQFPGELWPLGQNVSIAEAQQRTVGRPLVKEWLLPVLTTQPNCQMECDRIVELRVYQTGQPAHALSNRQYQLVTQLTVTGPDEASVVSPLIKSKTANPGSARSLPLTQIKPLEGNRFSKGWWSLSGEWVWEGQRISYGQIVRYNADQFYLAGMVNWSSPAGQEPIWQQVTGSATPELVINQTIGLEPQFEIYQLKPVAFVPHPVELQRISLLEPASSNLSYTNALFLARNGLWSLAAQWLRSFQANHSKSWTAETQAQFDLIRWHSRLAKRQAEQTWATPGQEVLASLMDGRWNLALAKLKTSDSYRREARSLLRADMGQIQQRVEAVLRVNPADNGAKTWKALLLAAKQDAGVAIAWAKSQPKTSAAHLVEIQNWITKVSGPVLDDPTQAVIALPPAGQLIGTATQLNQMQPSDWLKPKASPRLQRDPAQSWYRVQVMGFQDGRRWRFSQTGLGLPPRASGDELWKQLGLVTDPLLQLVAWTPTGEQQSLNGSIQAARLTGNQLELLVSADSPANNMARMPLLALTDAAVQWMNPEPIALHHQVQQAEWAERAIPTLVQELRGAGILSASQVLPWLGLDNWPIQVLPLTGKQPNEIVLTITPEMLRELNTKLPLSQLARPHTLIFSRTGTLLYSEFSQDGDKQYVASAELGEALPALLVKTTRGYRMLRWSAQLQRFE